jgi:hypothetical protein
MLSKHFTFLAAAVVTVSTAFGQVSTAPEKSALNTELEAQLETRLAPLRRAESRPRSAMEQQRATTGVATPSPELDSPMRQPRGRFPPLTASRLRENRSVALDSLVETARWRKAQSRVFARMVIGESQV